MTNKNARHYIADESIGGTEREYVEVERKADVGDLIYSRDMYFTVRDSLEEGIITRETFMRRHDDYLVLEPTDIVRIDGERYRLVRRHAEVGEDVLITDSECDYGVYGNGDVLESLGPVESDPLTVDETQASPEVIEMLANLARRVTQLEEQLRDTQRNVETFAQQTESNSEDIRLLDERTTCDCASKSGAELLAEAFGALTRYEKRGDRQCGR